MVRFNVVYRIYENNNGYEMMKVWLYITISNLISRVNTRKNRNITTFNLTADLYGIYVLNIIYYFIALKSQLETALLS